MTRAKTLVLEFSKHGQHQAQAKAAEDRSGDRDFFARTDLLAVQRFGNDASLEAAVVLDQTRFLQLADDAVIQLLRAVHVAPVTFVFQLISAQFLRDIVFLLVQLGQQLFGDRDSIEFLLQRLSVQLHGVRIGARCPLRYVGLLDVRGGRHGEQLTCGGNALANRDDPRMIRAKMLQQLLFAIRQLQEFGYRVTSRR